LSRGGSSGAETVHLPAPLIRTLIYILALKRISSVMPDRSYGNRY